MADPRLYELSEKDVCGILSEEAIEAAAIASAENHGAPDISGGLEVDDEIGVVYFKNAHGSVSLTMTIDAFNAWREANEL